jgi:probable rRNA maturation factor
MIDIENKTTLEIDEALLEKITSSMTDKDVELIVTDNTEMQKINKEHRNIDKTTDVLSFPYEEMPYAPLGSIVISYDKVKEKADAFGHSQSDEFTLLYIHGLLHLLGYDHECDSGEMRQKEEELIHLFALPKSLIVRTEGI